MDVLAVDKKTFRPGDLIEGYSSMIWTERYVDSGDFEMKTPIIDATKVALPLGSLITLRDSQELMFVESHYVEKNDSGEDILTVKGRSFDSFLECRQITPENKTTATDSPGARYGRPVRMKQSYNEATGAAVLAWNALVNTTTTDVIQIGVPPFPKSPLDAVPNLVVTDSSIGAGRVGTRWLKAGSVRDTFVKFLIQGNLGVRQIRPDSGPAKVVTVSSTGAVTKTTTSNITKLRVDIYNGINRTKDQTAVDPVVFRYTAGHLSNPKYLDSVQDYRNLGLVNSSYGPAYATLVDSDFDSSGLDRRTVYVDSGTYDPDNMTQVEWFDKQIGDGEVELKDRRKKTIFDSEISPFGPYKYNTDYFLGDLVTIQGEYSFTASMRVTEYVRSEDITGEVGYPTLNLPTA